MGYNLSIAILDDEQASVEMVSLTLRVAGVEGPAGFTDWNTACTSILKNHFDLLLLDVGMPDISGLKILEWMRKNKSKTSVIMLTGFNDAETAVACMKAGAVDYITKPVTPEKLIAAIQSVLVVKELSRGAEEAGISDESRIGGASRAVEIVENLEEWLEALPWEKEGENSFLKELRDLLVDNELYLDPECTLDKVAKRLGTNRSTLSADINNGLAVSFSTLLNRLRIGYFMRTAHISSELYSVEGLAVHAGFVSLTAFYEAFKKCTGTTPGKWMKTQI